MKKRVSLIPLSILHMTFGIIALVIPYMIIIKDSYSYSNYNEGYYSPFTTIAYPGWFGSRYAYVPYLLLVLAIILLLLFITLVPFSIVSVYKRSIALVPFILALVDVTLASLLFIAEVIIVLMSGTSAVGLFYIGDLLISAFLIPLTIILGLNFRDSRRKVEVKEEIPLIKQEEKQVPHMDVDTAEEIGKWKKLLDSGAITQEEYDKKKKELLK